MYDIFCCATVYNVLLLQEQVQHPTRPNHMLPQCRRQLQDASEC
jgi:hypothetical protein